MSNKSKQESALTVPFVKIPVLLILTLTGAGCTKGINVSELAVCSGLEAPITAHTDALVIDGGPMSLATGRVVVAAYDGACNG